uniref:helix-turn-helix transcriptional regulator n=1 Tax=uncultured Altererythrobacter sp. TaxID=500840 RepID=UPI0026045A90|nr:LuxR family transcriptional regulator [uncultured Altererythrobacter sp.]
MRQIESVTVANAMASFHRKLILCERIKHLNIICLRLASQLGARAVAYHHLPGIGSAEPVALNVVCVGFPADLVRHFEVNQVIKIDPTIQQILSSGKAAWWDDTPLPKKLSKTESDYLEYAASKVGFGIHLPAYGPNGRQGYVSIGFGANRPSFDRADMANIQLICQMAHQRYCQLLHEPLPKRVRLSPREREILSWVAEGKSNGVIAEILNLTESTVITYLERAFRKLDVDNRVTAAMRASTQGQLRHM